MRRLRVFDTQVQYDNIKCDLERAVIKVRENKSVNLNNEYLSQVAESDISDIKLKIDDFEFWVLSSKKIPETPTPGYPIRPSNFLPIRRF